MNCQVWNKKVSFDKQDNETTCHKMGFHISNPIFDILYVIWTKIIHNSHGGVMNNFLLVYTGGGMPETEEEQAAVMKAWGAWFESLGDRLVDGGNPTGPVAKTITSDGAVVDGPDGKMATGYSILKAENLDSAIASAKESPMLDGGGNITLYEIFPAM
jgi:hypothetical protein